MILFSEGQKKKSLQENVSLMLLSIIELIIFYILILINLPMSHKLLKHYKSKLPSDIRNTQPLPFAWERILLVLKHKLALQDSHIHHT